MSTTHICLDCKVDISDRAPNTRRCFDCAEEAQRESKRDAARRRRAQPEYRKMLNEQVRKNNARAMAKRRAQAFGKALGI